MADSPSSNGSATPGATAGTPRAPELLPTPPGLSLGAVSPAPTVYRTPGTDLPDFGTPGSAEDLVFSLQEDKTRLEADLHASAAREAELSRTIADLEGNLVQQQEVGLGSICPGGGLQPTPRPILLGRRCRLWPARYGIWRSSVLPSPRRSRPGLHMKAGRF